MRRGEVRWYRFQLPDKRRPVVVLTRDSAIDFLGEVTVAPITTKVRDIPSEAQLSRSDGMPRDCAANLDHVQTVPKSKLGGVVTSLSSVQMRDIGRAIRFALSLED